MQCDEPIVDVRYELNGAIIAVVLEHTGAYLYSTGPDAALKMHLKLPPRYEYCVVCGYCNLCYAMYCWSRLLCFVFILFSNCSSLISTCYYLYQ